MATALNPTRQRLVNAALDLFQQQGLAETTTKQIAELAEVNEVTLFRQFGNKQGLLLAVMDESEVFERLADFLGKQVQQARSEPENLAPAYTIRLYAQSYLNLLGSVPEVLRSLIGEAGKYPLQNREALGKGIQRMNQILAEYLAEVSFSLERDRWLSLVNSTLLGYAILEVTTEFHGLWDTREGFIDDLVQLILSPSRVGTATLDTLPLQPVVDLPATLVHTLFQRAHKKGLREWALIYLLFGAGVSPIEISRLERVHHLSDRDVQVIQITQGAIRQVPVNQWIMGKRYGTYQKNPLTQWLKSRKESQPALLIGTNEAPITVAEIQDIWQELTQGLLTLEGRPPAIEQAQQTWCVEMLLRGMSLEDMQILTGMSIEQLAPYGKRAKEKAVLEQGLLLDKKN